MVVVIDYGVGNLISIKNALDYLGVESKISSNPKDFKDANKLILPGVGSFLGAMEALEKKYGEYFSEPVVSWISILEKLTNEQVDKLSDLVKEYALRHGVDLSDHTFGFDQLFQEYLRQKSIKEAKEIVKSYKNTCLS